MRIYLTGLILEQEFRIHLCGLKRAKLYVRRQGEGDPDCPSPASCTSISHFQCQTEDFTFVLTTLGEQCLLMPVLY